MEPLQYTVPFPYALRMDWWVLAVLTAAVGSHRAPYSLTGQVVHSVLTTPNVDEPVSSSRRNGPSAPRYLPQGAHAAAERVSVQAGHRLRRVLATPLLCGTVCCVADMDREYSPLPAMHPSSGALLVDSCMGWKVWLPLSTSLTAASHLTRRWLVSGWRLTPAGSVLSTVGSYSAIEEASRQHSSSDTITQNRRSGMAAKRRCR